MCTANDQKVNVKVASYWFVENIKLIIWWLNIGELMALVGRLLWALVGWNWQCLYGLSCLDLADQPSRSETHLAGGLEAARGCRCSKKSRRPLVARPISVTRLPACRRTRLCCLLTFVFPSVSPFSLYVFPLIAWWQWCREPCAGIGGGRGVVGGGAY
jgi:hypothetical protein